jgi:hypothetical protein
MNRAALTVANCVLIAASDVALADRYWDGPGPANDNVVQGGSGTWNNGLTFNWTDATGAANTDWSNTSDDRNAVFGGLSAGIVSIEGSSATGSIDPRRMDFIRTGYLITNDNDPLSYIGGDNLLITVGAGMTAAIQARIRLVGDPTATLTKAENPASVTYHVSVHVEFTWTEPGGAPQASTVAGPATSPNGAPVTVLGPVSLPIIP